MPLTDGTSLPGDSGKSATDYRKLSYCRLVELEEHKARCARLEAALEEVQEMLRKDGTDDRIDAIIGKALEEKP